MVDEYDGKLEGRVFVRLVQIPLWSMNTLLVKSKIKKQSRSDSSMVDEYFIRSKDGQPKALVQIPLWSMNTSKTYVLTFMTIEFRFLYGR